MAIINEDLLNVVSNQAQQSPRLRMNYNFHVSMDEKCHRFLNAMEPGTVVPIHRHPTKDETFIIIRGTVKVVTYNDDGSMKEEIVLSPQKGVYGINILKGVWHTIYSLEHNSVLFEAKEGPFVPHEIDGLLNIE